MLGSFTYCTPTKIYFGEGAIENLGEAVRPFGKKVQLVYGKGSIKKNGIYDRIVEILKEEGKEIIDDGGVMSNPTMDRVMEGVEKAKREGTDFILAAGGGSCCDYAKAVSVCVNCEGDPWDIYWENCGEPEGDIIPVGCVLTMAGTGSEMNTGTVITNRKLKRKIGQVFENELVAPRFSILDPVYTYTLPKYQMVSGIFDIFSHLIEQYFSGDDDCTSDYISEGIMRSVIHSGNIALENPQDYEARSNIMWCATWALNTLVEKGKTTDWMVHMMGEAVSAHTDATHGMTLSAISVPYYRYLRPYAPAKFAAFARNVFGISEADDEKASVMGIDAMEEWMKKLGLVMHLSQLGVKEEMIPAIARSALILDGGYHVFDIEEIEYILKESL